MTKKNSKSKTATVNTNLTNAEFLGKIRHLTVGKSVTSNRFGTVKCTKSAKDSKNGKKMFSVSQSHVSRNGGNFTFEDVCKAFHLGK